MASAFIYDPVAEWADDSLLQPWGADIRRLPSWAAVAKAWPSGAPTPWQTRRLELPEEQVTPFLRAARERGCLAWPAQAPLPQDAVGLAREDDAMPPGSYASERPNGIGLGRLWAVTRQPTYGSLVRIVERRVDPHPDLPNGLRVVHGAPSPDPEDQARQHGTRTAGVLFMRHNGSYGYDGVFSAGLPVVAYAYSHGTYAPERAIVAAALDVGPGGVVVVEEQAGEENHEIPPEGALEMWMAIRLATALGVVVAEPAGNGAQPLDDWIDPVTRLQRLRADSPWHSGALVCAAGELDDHGRWTRETYSSYGGRVDLFVRSYCMSTVVMPDGTATFGMFRNTSAATAILGGAAALLQELRTHRCLQTLSPRELAHAVTGAGVAVDGIGTMPDLPAIVARF